MTYQEIFELEQKSSYPAVDAVEEECGHAIDRRRLEGAARVLACPLKVNPPNWQHGRVIYAVLSEYLDGHRDEFVACLDVGTAKGFSALCAAWALRDAGARGMVYSVDVLDPMSSAKRNSVLDLEGPTTVRQLLEPWHDETRLINLECCSGEAWLRLWSRRVHFAFLDGKHSYAAVSSELSLLGCHHEPGDVVIADDVQVPGVRDAVLELRDYDVRIVGLLPNRSHAILRRK